MQLADLKVDAHIDGLVPGGPSTSNAVLLEKHAAVAHGMPETEMEAIAYDLCLRHVLRYRSWARGDVRTETDARVLVVLVGEVDFTWLRPGVCWACRSTCPSRYERLVTLIPVPEALYEDISHPPHDERPRRRRRARSDRSVACSERARVEALSA